MNRNDNRSGELYTWLLRITTLCLMLLVGWNAGRTLYQKKELHWKPNDSRLKVLTTIFPLYDMARVIGGDNVQVMNLLPPGTDPHEFSLSPADMTRAAGADVMIINGSGLDNYISKAFTNSHLLSCTPLDVSHGIPLLASSEKEDGVAQEKNDTHSGDPHLWMDPEYARIYAARITTELIRAEKQRNASDETLSSIKLRGSQYDSRLASLSRQYRLRTSRLTSRSFIAFHGAYRYLAARYNLNVAAVWQSTPGREPAPGEVGALIRMVKTSKVRALFSEPEFSTRAIEIIGKDCNLPVYRLDPVETAEDFSKAHYVDIMQQNLDTLVKGLK